MRVATGDAWWTVFLVCKRGVGEKWVVSKDARGKGIGFDVFNDDSIIMEGTFVLRDDAWSCSLRLGVRFFFSFCVNLLRWIERAITGVEMLLEVCPFDALLREMDDRLLEIARLNFSKLCVSILGLPFERLMVGYKYWTWWQNVKTCEKDVHKFDIVKMNVYPNVYLKVY